MIEANLSQYFAGRTKEIFPAGTTPIRPFTAKPVMYISFGVGVFVGYEGLEWIWNFHIDHIDSIVVRQTTFVMFILGSSACAIALASFSVEAKMSRSNAVA